MLFRPFRFVHRIVSLVVLAAVVYYAVSAVQVLTASRAPGAIGVGPREEVIIVVGPDVTSGKAISSSITERLLHGAALFKA
ncbi:MAG: hypothetical protein ACYDBS_10565, partial [Acidimicrobiales bacterium]